LQHPLAAVLRPGENTIYMIGGFYRNSKGLRHTGFTGDLGGQIQASVENVTNTLALTEGNIRTVGSANANGYFLGRPIFGRHATITAAVKF